MDVREKLFALFQDCNNPSWKWFPNNAEMLKLINYLIAHSVTVQDWIPVTKPPKEKGVYIVTVKHWLDGKPVTREAKWNGDDWLSCYKAEEITPRVTHWTYMPQPPKGE